MEETYAPLIPETVPTTTRISRAKFYGGLAVLALLLLGGLYTYLWQILSEPDTRRQSVAPVAESQGQGPRDTGNPLQMPKSYAKMEPALPPPSFPQPQIQQSTSIHATQTPPPPSNGGTMQANPLLQDPAPPRKPPRLPEPPGGKVVTASHPPGGAPAGPPAQKPKKPAWLFPDAKSLAIDPPFPVPKDEEQKTSKLFPKAVHEIPANPLRVVYRSQVINGTLMHAINSDAPGPVRIQATEEITDKFGQGYVLIPQWSVLLGTQGDAKVEYGQSRVQITLDSIERPDGSVIALGKAKAGDEQGAAGIPGQVNNHYLKLGISAVLTSLLSVGSRSVGGDTQGFQPTIQQELSKDISRSANETGQNIIKRQLQVPPTITIPQGTAVTLQLGENLNLQDEPIVVRK